MIGKFKANRYYCRPKIYQMTLHFPIPFSERQLRVSNHFAWIHATAMIGNDIKELRKANRISWLYATRSAGKGLTKRVFTQLDLYR